MIQCDSLYVILLPTQVLVLGAKLLPHQGAPTSLDKQQHMWVLDKEKLELGARVAQLAEGSLALLELIFPRHVIEFMSDSHQATQKLLPPGTDLQVLASRHEQVCVHMRVWGGHGGPACWCWPHATSRCACTCVCGGARTCMCWHHATSRCVHACVVFVGGGGHGPAGPGLTP